MDQGPVEPTNESAAVANPEHVWTQDEIDEDAFVDDEEDDGDECGRWNNGRLTRQCRLAGTEWCDWSCPIGTRAHQGTAR